MKVPIVVTALALALGAWSVAGMERAQPREGGTSRGGDSGAAVRQPSSGGTSSGSQVSGGYERSSGSNQTAAQRRQPRPGSGTGHGGYRGHYGHRDYYGGYYGYYPGYYGYYDWWYGPGWYSSWGYYPGYRYRYRGGDSNNGSLRVQVNPDQARVYVDGYYAGVVDDFDGLFQRLNLQPGRHELSFKLEGYKTHRVRLYVPPDQTLKIRYDMVRGAGEDSVDDTLDKPALEWAERERQQSRDRGDRYSFRDRDRDSDSDDERETTRERDTERGAGIGVLNLDVEPDQAAVYVDGAFRGTGRDVDELNLPPGRHHVEVVAPGFKTFDREVDVKAGDTQELSVELERP